MRRKAAVEFDGATACLQEPDLYESGWTPLMAATVAPAPHHLNVAELLLSAAAAFVPVAAKGQAHELMKGGAGCALCGGSPPRHYVRWQGTAADVAMAELFSSEGPGTEAVNAVIGRQAREQMKGGGGGRALNGGGLPQHLRTFQSSTAADMVAAPNK